MISLSSFRHPLTRPLLRPLLALFVLTSSLPSAAATTAQALPEVLHQQAMDSSLTQEQRINAIKSLYSSMLVDGEIPPRKICVWDVLGRSGPIYATALDQQARLMDLGVRVEIDAYTNEGVLADDLKAGQCDAALFTGIRARLFNRFTGTIDAIGAIPSSEHMKLLMQVLVNPKNADKMEEGPYVVMGFASMGAAYIFVNDRQISSLTKAAGKRVAVMDYDPIQAEMILQIGANPVPTSVVSAGSKFNNHAVDVLPAPLVAYNMMELYRGMGKDGGIVDYPFSQLTLQLVGRRDKFPTEIAQLVREDFYRRFADIEKLVDQQTGSIPGDVWIGISDEEKASYQQMMQEARITLRDRGYYDSGMLTLQRKVRCRFNPANSECAQPVE
ncbi:putative solute-binding protein [Thalassolituus sp. LLYu03]|uniref:putative solute-binding protein n=1 Tax=Thalassolituus sp. LLYu03 TaxID=3421656 RepID=UPI003D29AEBC